MAETASAGPLFYAVIPPPGHLSQEDVDGYYMLQAMTVNEFKGASLYKWLLNIDPNIKYQIPAHLAPHIR